MARLAERIKPHKPAPRPERVKAFRLGLSAESRAAMLLIAKAYRIVPGASKRGSARATLSPAAAAR